MRKFLILILLFITNSAFSQNGKLPMVELSKNKIDFGQNKIMEKKCSTLVIKNIGDTTSRLYFADKIKLPFYGKIDYIQDIKVDSSLKIDICYQPIKYGKDSQRVFINLDTRISHSIGLLFDISNSMDEYLSDGKMRITAAVNAGKSFINSMLLTPTVYDEAAIYTFCKDFWKNCDFTTDKTKLKNSLVSTLCSNTYFYNAVIKSINDIKTRQFAKVLIALTDGEDNAFSATVNQCITLANANKVKIYTIGVGSDVADNNLRLLAESTGGEFFRGNTSKELEDIYYKIFNLLSKNIEVYFDIIGNSPSPELTMNCPPKENTMIMGDTVEFPIYLRNVDSITFYNQPFTLNMKFNQTMLLPLQDNFKFNNNGTTTIKSINKIPNLDTIPLITLKFLTLNGDSSLTNLELTSIKWDNIDILLDIISDSKCEIYLNSCVKNLRQVKLFNTFGISENYPNPFSEKSYIDVFIEQPGNYKLSLFNQLGERIIDNIINSYLTEGIHKFEIDANNLRVGTYILILYTNKGNYTKIINIIK